MTTGVDFRNRLQDAKTVYLYEIQYESFETYAARMEEMEKLNGGESSEPNQGEDSGI